MAHMSPSLRRETLTAYGLSRVSPVAPPQSDSRRLGSNGGSGSLTLPLLILTAQQRSIIVNHTDSKLIKFIATMYDRCQVRFAWRAWEIGALAIVDGPGNSAEYILFSSLTPARLLRFSPWTALMMHCRLG